MLSNTLNTNEVKDRSGTEVEFQYIKSSDRTKEWAVITEAPNLPHRLKVSHQEIGAGTAMRRRSSIRVDKSIAGVSTKPAPHACYIVLDIPVGDIADYNAAKDVLAELTSLVATLATTTFLYDGTGNGAAALISGGL